MNRIVKSLLPGLLAGAFALPAMAQDAFSTIIDEVVANDASLAAERSRINAAIAAERAENVLPDPDVDFDYKWGRREAGDRWGVSVTQSFDWPGLYRARRNALSERTMAMENAHSAVVADLRLETKQMLIDIVLTRQQLELLYEIKHNLDSLGRSLDKAYAGGEATVIMMRKFKHELYNVRTRIDDAESNLDALRLAIIAKNGGNYIDLGAIRDYPAEKLLAESDYLDMLEQHDSRLASLRELEMAAEGNLKVEKMKRLPGFKLGYVHEKEGDEHFNGLTAGINLPLWSRKNALASAKENLFAAQDDNRAYKLQQTSAVMTDYALAKKLNARSEEYAAIFGNDYTRLLQKSFFGGQMTVFEYLNEINWYMESKLDYLSLKHQQAQTMARLNKWI